MKRRIVIIAIAGVLLVAAVVLVPSQTAGDPNDNGDPPCLASHFGLACDKDDAAIPDHPLVGRWIRVYPPEQALDTLMLSADGAVAGSVRGFDSLGVRLLRWKIGHRLMPGGLCLGDGERSHCQGFVLSGDTLWLANGRRTVYLRLASDGPRQEFQAWQTPKGAVAPPQPGSSVSPPPAGFKKGPT